MAANRRVPDDEECLAPSFQILSFTIPVIKQILDRHGIYYKSTLRKPELAQLFEEKIRCAVAESSSAAGQSLSGVKKEFASSEGEVNLADGSLCQAKLALTGDTCVNIAHDGFRTCGIGSHREQEPLFAKKATPNTAITGLAQSLGNVFLNKPVANGLVEENKRLKEVVAKYESKIVENSQVIADLESENRHLASMLTALRDKINKMAVFIEELFDGDMGA